MSETIEQRRAARKKRREEAKAEYERKRAEAKAKREAKRASQPSLLQILGIPESPRKFVNAVGGNASPTPVTPVAPAPVQPQPTAPQASQVVQPQPTAPQDRLVVHPRPLLQISPLMHALEAPQDSGIGSKAATHLKNLYNKATEPLGTGGKLATVLTDLYKKADTSLRTPETQQLLGQIAMALTSNFPQSPQYALGKYVADSAESEMFDKYLDAVRKGENINPEDFPGLRSELKQLAYDIDTNDRAIEQKREESYLEAGIETEKMKAAKRDKEVNRAYKVLFDSMDNPNKEEYIDEKGNFKPGFYQALSIGSLRPKTDAEKVATRNAVMKLYQLGEDTFGLEQGLFPELDITLWSDEQYEAFPSGGIVIDKNGRFTTKP